MSEQTELWVDRGNLFNTKVVHVDQEPLQDGEIRVAIEKFALTANNVTYAVAGDMVGYWQFYPAQDEWGKVPVWGIAEVVESRLDDIATGERLYGFLPMVSHTVLRPGEISKAQFTDVSVHRSELPLLYNQYRRTAAEADFLQSMEDERCLLFPLLATSYLLYDYLLDNDCFNAGQIIIGSASSKTGLGLAHLLHRDATLSQRVVALTSAGNRDFVSAQGVYDQVVCYGEESTIDATVAAAYVDMSGDATVTAAVHNLLQDKLVESCAVGATHWESFGETPELPGAKPELFFAPAQVQKRDAQWGVGVVMGKAMAASAETAGHLADSLHIERIKGADAAAAAWVAMVNNQVSPQRGLILSLLN